MTVQNPEIREHSRYFGIPYIDMWDVIQAKLMYILDSGILSVNKDSRVLQRTSEAFAFRQESFTWYEDKQVNDQYMVRTHTSKYL